jgi:molecular chaperone GrpE (heat shock protein)
MHSIYTFLYGIIDLLKIVEPFLIMLIFLGLIIYWFTQKTISLEHILSVTTSAHDKNNTILMKQLPVKVLKPIQDELNTIHKDIKHSVMLEMKNHTEKNNISVKETESPLMENEHYQFIKKQFDLYCEKKDYLVAHDNEKSIQTVADCRNKFNQLKSFLTHLAKTVDDDLIYEIIELLETIDVDKDDRLLTFPLDIKNHEQNLTQLKQMAKDVSRIESIENFNDLLCIHLVNVRNGSDLDYRMNDQAMDSDSNLKAFMKHQLNTLLLIIKQLDNKFKLSLNRMLIQTLELDHQLSIPLKTINTDSLVALWFDPATKDSDKKIQSVLSQADDIIRSNFSTASKLSEKVNQFEKRYFAFLNSHLIKPLLELFSLHKSLKKRNVKNDLVVSKWVPMIESMIKIYMKYMKNVLSIEKISTKRGDIFDPDIHIPVSEGEPDSALDDNQIKSLISNGFIFKQKKQLVVIRPAEVVVVKNVT